MIFMKILLLTLSLLLPFTLFAEEASQDHHQVRLLTKIKSKGSHILIQRENGAVITGHLATKDLEKSLGDLEAGDDALIEGYISYENVMVEGTKSIKPKFTVTSIHPVSLKRLGKIDMKEVERYLPQNLKPIPYEPGPQGFPLSNRAINAMLLTASVLTIQSLTTSDLTPQGQQDMTSALFISAGALATGYFIYEQVINKVKD